VDTRVPSFADRFAEIRACVDAALDRYTAFPSGCPQALAEAIRYSLLAPGKRLRPVLVVMAAEACGGSAQAAMPGACAVEMVHTYSLIHDDLPAMDNDDLRRGQPTCHKRFGDAMAILAGDALLALAFEVLATGIRPPSVAAACCQALAEAAGPRFLVGGQADDIRGGNCGAAFPGGSQSGVVAEGAQAPQAGLEALESVHSRKTGAMIRVSLRLGGLIAGAGTGRISALERYGQHLGLAFQITDDVLDVRGEESTVGKRLGKDSRLGKLTFPGLVGVEASLGRAEQAVGEARDVLRPLGIRAGGLDALACYVLERNR